MPESLKILIYLVYMQRSTVVSYRRTEADKVLYDHIGRLQRCKVLNFCLLSSKAHPKQIDHLSALHVLDVLLANIVKL